MKIFEVTIDVMEVTTDVMGVESKEIILEKQYVTSDDDTMKTVVDHFSKYCFEIEANLVCVREVLTIVQNIRSSKRG